MLNSWSFVSILNLTKEVIISLTLKLSSSIIFLYYVNAPTTINDVLLSFFISEKCLISNLSIRFHSLFLVSEESIFWISKWMELKRTIKVFLFTLSRSRVNIFSTRFKLLSQKINDRLWFTSETMPWFFAVDKIYDKSIGEISCSTVFL